MDLFALRHSLDCISHRFDNADMVVSERSDALGGGIVELVAFVLA